MSRRKNKEKRRLNKSNSAPETTIPVIASRIPKPLRALNDKQQKYINAINNHDIVVGTGYPGTGKSYIPAAIAAKMFQDPNCPINKIVICRPNVGAAETIGLVPGDIDEKMKAWCAPIIDVLYQQLGKSFVDYLIKEKRIELLPLEYARGRSYDNTFIILDEAQNVGKEPLKCLMTRMGRGTKLVIDGDVGQCDIGSTSGLGQLITLINDFYTPMRHVDFEIKDIVRSDICKFLIELFVEAKF